MTATGEKRTFGRRGLEAPGPSARVVPPVVRRGEPGFEAEAGDGFFSTRETPAFSAFEAWYPRVAGALAVLAFVAYTLREPAMRSVVGLAVSGGIGLLFYFPVRRVFEGLRGHADTLYRLRTGQGSRSRWFLIGALCGGLAFVVNDRLDLVPLSPTDALIRVTFGSQEALIAAIDRSRIMEDIDTTFAYSRDGMTINRTRPDGTVSDPERNKAEWERTKRLLDANGRVMWFVDLGAIAVACGFALNTLMVRVFGLAAPRTRSDA